MGSLLDDIKNISFYYIESNYKEYLKDNNILLIKEENMKNVIKEFYEVKSKNFKDNIRNKLKEKYKENYPSASVENIILDMFQDKELNINRLVEEFCLIQKKNIKKIELPLINNSLNLNIGVKDNYIIINSCNSKNIVDSSLNDIYNIINNYKFLYSIEDVILEEVNEQDKINTIKKIINNKDKINIEVYYLKN